LAASACLIPLLLGFSDSVDDIPAGLVTFSQMSLLSLWVGFGRTRWPLKLMLVLAAGLTLSILIVVTDQAGGTAEFWFVAIPRPVHPSCECDNAMLPGG